MKKMVTFIAAIAVALLSGQANAQCVGCSQSVTPSFGGQVYSTPVQYGNTMSYGTPVYNSMPSYYSAPVYNTASMTTYAAPMTSGCVGCSGSAVSQPVFNGGMVMTGTPTYNSMPVYSSGTVMTSAPVYSGVPMYGTPVNSGCVGCSGNIVSQPVFNGTPMYNSTITSGQVINGNTVIGGTVISEPVAQPTAAQPAATPAENKAEAVDPPTPTPDGT